MTDQITWFPSEQEQIDEIKRTDKRIKRNWENAFQKWSNNSFIYEDDTALDMAIEALTERNIARDIATIIENEQDMRVMLQNADRPTLDEVVRCKDCRYYNPIDENKPYPCGYGMYMCNKDDFCSYGERKEA